MNVHVSRHRTMPNHILVFKAGEPWIGHDDERMLLTGEQAADVADQLSRLTISDRPKRVTLCGSARFSEAFQQANLRETMAGNIVLSIGCDLKGDDELFSHMDADELAALKQRLDDLHKRKIDISDEILVLNVDGYIGNSTRSEIAYAKAKGKAIRWLEPEHAVEVDA